MALVTFPSGLVDLLDRTSTFSFDNGTQLDATDNGAMRLREISETTRLTLSARFKYLTETEKNTLTDFLTDSRADIISWQIDGQWYLGYVQSNFRVTMRGNRFDVSFTFEGTPFTL